MGACMPCLRQTETPRLCLFRKAATSRPDCGLGSDAVVLLLVAMPVVRVSMLQALVPFSVWIAYQASTKMILEEANALTARAVGFQ